MSIKLVGLIGYFHWLLTTSATFKINVKTIEIEHKTSRCVKNMTYHGNEVSGGIEIIKINKYCIVSNIFITVNVFYQLKSAHLHYLCAAIYIIEKDYFLTKN